MSDYKPITGELRGRMNTLGWYDEDGSIVCTTGGEPASEIASLVINSKTFGELCDAIDAIHAQLERENAELRERVAEMDNVRESMHGGITDELREWAEDSTLSQWTVRMLLAIADRIDAEHERQLEVLYRDMSEAEYVKLHKDTGGEYIREHDKVDWRDHSGTWHENATVVAVCSDGCYVMDGTVFHVHKSDIRHHHAPTVEDVLREFAYGLGVSVADSYIAASAAKLRLAESEGA